MKHCWAENGPCAGKAYDNDEVRQQTMVVDVRVSELMAVVSGCYVMVDDAKYTQGSVVIVIITNLL